jgi:DMSO/TMAO reductase YedYZ heme-binding membrane subunit
MSVVAATGLFGNEQLWWYVSRAGGIIALLLAAASVIWGLLLSTKVLDGQPSPKWLLSLHRYLGTLSVVFTGVHVVGLVADNFVHFGWADILVPFASSWKPGAVAWGIVTMYLLIAVQLTSVFMKRIPRRWWKRIHLTSYLLFWTGIIHGVQAGTDGKNPLYIASTALLTLIVVFLTVFRVLTARRHRSTVASAPVVDEVDQTNVG